MMFRLNLNYARDDLNYLRALNSCVRLLNKQKGAGFIFLEELWYYRENSRGDRGGPTGSAR